MDNYLKPYKWTYLKETVFSSNLSTQNSGHFRITNGISKPRHVFVFFINNANINNQLQNPFLYNTFSVSTNPRTLNRCYLEVGNGNEYPRVHYKPIHVFVAMFYIYMFTCTCFTYPRVHYKPIHVFVFFINNANINNQLQNPFLYNTFSVSTNPRTLNRCYLEVGNGNEYPRVHYKPTEDPLRVFRDVMKYVNANNDFQGGILLSISNFKTLYPFVYFDLTKQKMDIKDGVTKLSLHYELSGATATDYIIYGIVLSEQEAEIEKD